MITDAQFALLRSEVHKMSLKLALIDPSTTRGVSVTNIIGVLALSNIVNNESPTGTINGLNTVFVLSAAPSPPESLIVVLSGVVQLFGTNYTLSGNTITFAVAPPGGSWLRAYYTKGG